MSRLEKIAVVVVSIFFAYLLVAAQNHWVPLGLTEVLGTITGAAGVYLTVKRSIWNFPIGLANNIFFFVLFSKSRLYNDMGLQVVYFVLGAWGWWVWSRGASQKEELPIGRADWKQIAGCLVFVALGTFFMTKIAVYWGGAAPFWDALTTALCLAAQYLLGRKWIENWAFWLLADVIYVPLYLHRGLNLTAMLYFGFLCLCVMGYFSWLKEWKLRGLPQEHGNSQPESVSPIAAPWPEVR